MTESTPNPREASCRFCGGYFDARRSGRLAKHERECEHKTPEQRKTALQARETYRQRYSVAANGTSKRAGESAQRYMDRLKKPRRFYKEPSPATALEERRHQSKLKKAREYYAKYGRAGKSGALEREVKKASVLLNGKRRVQITLSLDWDTLREFIIQVAPDVVVDRVQLL